MLSILVALALTASEPSTSQADLNAARTWVSLVDAKRWDESWNTAGALFKSQMPQTRWASGTLSVRYRRGR